MAIWLDINLNQVLVLRGMNRNGVRQDIKVVGNSTDNQYFIPSTAVEYRKSKMWLRHELLLV